MFVLTKLILFWQFARRGLMYEKHAMEAIVLGHTARGGDDARYVLLTDLYGRIFASARGVRKVESKLRYALQDLSHVHVSLVKGKYDWRITNATAISSLYFCMQNDRVRIRALVSICALVARLVHGEGEHAMLFPILIESATDLSQTPQDDVPMLQDIAYARILHTLGYLGDIVSLHPLFGGNTSVRLTHARKLGSALQIHINDALQATHL